MNELNNTLMSTAIGAEVTGYVLADVRGVNSMGECAEDTSKGVELHFAPNADSAPAVVVCIMPDRNPLLVLRQLVVVLYKFLLTCFDSKVGLTDSNNLFAGVTVHHDQIAGIAGKHKIFNFPNTAVGHRG